MAHRRYTTAAFILGWRPQGEANRLYRVLTPDFGLINVFAQGVRLEKSKLRYQLTNYSLVNLELVHGREYWRLVGVERQGFFNNQEQNSLIKRISLILFRLIHGEEPKPKIFADLKMGWGMLEKVSKSDLASRDTTSKLESLEIFILIRILADLGYLADTTETAEILGTNEPDLAKIFAKRTALIRLINSSLAESGL